MWVSSIRINIENVVLNQLIHLISNWSGSGNPYYQHCENGFIWTLRLAVQYILYFSFFWKCTYAVKKHFYAAFLLQALLLVLSSLSVAAQLFLPFQGARLVETCCLPVLNIPMAIEPEFGTTLFWHNGSFLLLRCIVSAMWQICPDFASFETFGEIMQFALVRLETSFFSVQLPGISFYLVMLSCSGDGEGTVPLAQLTAFRMPSQGGFVFNECSRLRFFRAGQAGCRQRLHSHQLRQAKHRAALSCLYFADSLLESCPWGQ